MTQPFSVRDYWESRLRQSYSLEGVGYRKLGRHYNAWMYRVRARVFARATQRIGLEWASARVMDVGSGTGFYVEQWHRLGVPGVTGVDITDTAVGKLRQRFPRDTFVRADIGNETPPGVAPGSMDAVSAMDVLFHIVDDAEYARAFTHIAATLKPGGWFVWSDNFLRRPAERVTHQVSRPLAESERLVRAAGFEVVARVPMFVLMNYPADSRGRLARWAWTAMVAPAALAEPFGWVVGGLLAPVDTWLSGWMRESPTTEIMLCRKRPDPPG